MEVCIIVKDSSKAWVQALIAEFPKQLSYIKKVLSLTSLRKKHAQYQDKRDLCNAYQLFLVDDCILPMVGKLLGKSFFMKKKQPVPVKLTRKESLPYAIEKCIKSTFLMIGAGTCLSVKTASTVMASQSIEQNIQSVIKNVIPHVPRKTSNISSISIKTDTSTALPIYNKVREELNDIARLAKIERSSSNSKKRTLDDEGSTSNTTGGGDDVLKAKEDEDRKKKQKKESSVKSPLLKALKRKKRNDIEEQEKVEDSATQSEQEQVDTPGKVNRKKAKVKNTLPSDHDQKTATPKKNKDVLKKKTSTPEKNTETLSAKKKKKKIIAKDDNSSEEKSDFISSKKFQGSKKGYVFKKGGKGVGYYVDIVPVPDTMALEALARSSKKGSGNSGKSRRQSTSKSPKGGAKGRKGRRSF